MRTPEPEPDEVPPRPDDALGACGALRSGKPLEDGSARAAFPRSDWRDDDERTMGGAPQATERDDRKLVSTSGACGVPSDGRTSSASAVGRRPAAPDEPVKSSAPWLENQEGNALLAPCRSALSGPALAVGPSSAVAVAAAADRGAALVTAGASVVNCGAAAPSAKAVSIAERRGGGLIVSSAGA